MAKVRPPAGLAPRDDGDENLTLEQLEQLSLFKQLSQQPDLEEYPGTAVLRRYRAGDVICRLGEPGWTAFYILTAQDLHELRDGQLSVAGGDPRARRWRDDLDRLKALPPAPGPRRAATVHLGGPRATGLWDGLKRLAARAASAAPQESPLFEGEVFGEMSCLYRTPRSATVVADADCYMLEFLRNIFDKMLSNRNKAFKEQIDRAYRDRVLDLQLRNLPMFRDLPPELIARLRQRVELRDLEPGDLVCEENDRPDALYIVRTGFVQALKNVTFLFGEDEIRDWPALCSTLFSARLEPPGPRRKVWDQVADLKARQAIEKLASGVVAFAEGRDEVLYALNDLLRQPKLSAAPEFKDVLASAGLADEAKKLPANVRKAAQHQQVCSFNRRLLEAVFPGAVPPLRRAADASRVLAYQSPGDIIGEIGLVTGRPRSATCVAYGHPDSKFGRVEVVRLSRELFDEIMAAVPDLHGRVAEQARRLLDQTREKLSLPRWDETNPLVLSERFNELGLIQGQKLMVIDLDRCTRCDECVKACVATHDDGRSRLFLDGPRFKDHRDGRLTDYLVPATCRQCKDPVCLIGCPVGSIHKGDNGQIVIEDWCIGCRRCAEQCPYGAIQMHPVGVLARGSGGWRVRAAPGSAERGRWQDDGYDDRSWGEGRAPFRYDRELREWLFSPREIHFRHTFAVTGPQPAWADKFHLQVLSEAPAVTVWVNGEEVARNEPGEKPQPKQDKQERWNLEATLALRSQADLVPSHVRPLLRPGRNVVAVSAAAPADGGPVLLEAGVYRLSRPAVPEGMSGEFAQELVMNTAVVCDMCSEKYGRRPACVNACPHGAALRVDARATFVTRA